MQSPRYQDVASRHGLAFLAAFMAVFFITLVLTNLSGKAGEVSYWATALPVSIQSYSFSNGEARLYLINRAINTLHISSISIANNAYSVDVLLFPNEARGVVITAPYDPFETSPQSLLICPVGKDFSFQIGFAVDTPDEPGKQPRKVEGVRNLQGKCSNRGACLLAGAPCGSPYDCCSGSCATGRDFIRRCREPGVCSQDYDPCTSDSECCSGKCDGYHSICKSAFMCSPIGEHCLADSDCCFGSCAGLVCRETGLCANIGGECLGDSECCSKACDEIAGTCMVNKSCTADLGKCYRSSNCCSGNCVGGECWLKSSCNSFNQSCRSDSECCSRRCFNYRCG